MSGGCAGEIVECVCMHPEREPLAGGLWQVPGFNVFLLFSCEGSWVWAAEAVISDDGIQHVGAGERDSRQASFKGEGRLRVVFGFRYGVSTRHDSTAVGYDGKKINSLDRKGIEKIQHAGFGVCLIKLDVVKKLRPPLFLMDFIPALGTQCGEDVYFSQKMAEIGVDLWVDHDLSKELGHVGKRIYSFKDIDPKDLESHNSILE
jgi:hypothetical protein